MRITTVAVACDVCKNPKRKTHRYRMGDGEGLFAFELCREHAAPLRAILATGGEPLTPAPRVKVWQMDEIETLKKEGKS